MGDILLLNPKLLPRREYFTQLVKQEVHRQLIHTGVSHTLNQEHWVPQGWAEVRHIIKSSTP